jgi:hypothetical protein
MEMITFSGILDTEALQGKIALHQHHSGVTFRILEQTKEALTISVKQDPKLLENLFDAKKLAEIVKETFSPHTNLAVRVRVITPTSGPPDVVTSEWILNIMSKYHISNKTLVEDLGVEKASISAYVNGQKPLSDVVRAMFYFYFKSNGFIG